MKVAMVGSRHLTDSAVSRRVSQYIANLPKDTIIITGDASGIDHLVSKHSYSTHILIVVRPAWERDGKAAGPRRNAIIARMCDRMVAFWDGKSRGTLSAIKEAELYLKPVEVIRFDR